MWSQDNARNGRAVRGIALVVTARGAAAAAPEVAL
jgi:hypothetical protein